MIILTFDDPKRVGVKPEIEVNLIKTGQNIFPVLKFNQIRNWVKIEILKLNNHWSSDPVDDFPPQKNPYFLGVWLY